MNQGCIGLLNGMEVYVNENSQKRKQNRFPKTKRKRVRKKWYKNPANWILVPVALMINNKIIIHPSAIPTLELKHATT